MRRVIILACTGLLALIVASQCVYTVEEARQAILLQLGKPVAGPLGPGCTSSCPSCRTWSCWTPASSSTTLPRPRS